jgi:hypothetical protein
MSVWDDYLKSNKDWGEFVEQVSDNTGDRNLDKWIQNLRDNRELFRMSGWATVELQDVEKDKTAIIMGASPALKNQVATLREIQNDSDFVLAGLSCNLEFLLKNGIKPKYCITVDADVSQAEFWDNINMNDTKDILLIASTLAYPPMLKKWKGPVKFLALSTEEKDMKRKQEKWYRPLNGVGIEFWSLMGQFNVMTAFAFTCLACPILIFVGNEMSYQTVDSDYYVDRPAEDKDFAVKGAHPDIYGKVVYTTVMLMALKFVLENFLQHISGGGWFFNCTEAGIFGVTKRHGNLPWIWQFTLKNGIAQARQIMRTGKPFTI